MRQLPSATQKAHLFALFHQIYRAFFNIFECVIGQSLPAAKLRAGIWQSIFTHDLRRFRRSLYRTLHQVTTLCDRPQWQRQGTGCAGNWTCPGTFHSIPGRGSFLPTPVANNFRHINISSLFEESGRVPLLQNGVPANPEFRKKLRRCFSWIVAQLLRKS